MLVRVRPAAAGPAIQRAVLRRAPSAGWFAVSLPLSGGGSRSSSAAIAAAVERTRAARIFSTPRDGRGKFAWLSLSVVRAGVRGRS